MYKVSLVLLCILTAYTSEASTDDKTDLVKQTLLDRHNLCRTNASPAPTTALANLTWDDTLSAFAKQWAATQPCGNPAHANETDRGGEKWGENLSYGYGSASFYDSDSDVITKASDGVDGWCNEKQYYTLSSNACQDGKVCGHYKQVVWDRSTLVGCGMVICDTGNSNYPRGYNLVCEYKDQGNYGGCKPYNRQAGDGCSLPTACVNGTTSDYVYADTYILRSTDVCDTSVNEYCKDVYRNWYVKATGAFIMQASTLRKNCS